MTERDLDAAAHLIERLLADPAFRAGFRADPVTACREAGLDDVADELAFGGSALQTLDGRESRSSLAGVLVAAAVEGVAVWSVVEHAHLPTGGIEDVLDRVHLPKLPALPHRGGGAPPPLALDPSRVALDPDGAAAASVGNLDPRVSGLLGRLSEDHHVTARVTGQSAVDITSIDGNPVTGDDAGGRAVANALADLGAKDRPAPGTSPWALSGGAAGGDHVRVAFGAPEGQGGAPDAPAPASSDAASAHAAPASDADPAPSDAASAQADPAPGADPAPSGAASAQADPDPAPAHADPAPPDPASSGAAASTPPDASVAATMPAAPDPATAGAADPTPATATPAPADPVPVAAAVDVVAVTGGYPGNGAGKAQIAAWMADEAQRRGLPRELPVMASLVESGITNNPGGDADSAGFFQMRVGIWDTGAYAGFRAHPELQVKWFLDNAEQVRSQRVAAGQPVDDPQAYGDWIADVERPAAQYRGRYQLRLDEARSLLGEAGNAPATVVPVAVPADPAAAVAAAAPATPSVAEAAAPVAGPAASPVAAVAPAPSGPAQVDPPRTDTLQLRIVNADPPDRTHSLSMAAVPASPSAADAGPSDAAPAAAASPPVAAAIDAAASPAAAAPAPTGAATPAAAPLPADVTPPAAAATPAAPVAATTPSGSPGVAPGPGGAAPAHIAATGPTPTDPTGASGADVVAQMTAGGLHAGPHALAAVAAARAQLGSAYLWGGSSPTTGFDCSGLMQWAYAQQGIAIPRVTYTQIAAAGAEHIGRGDLLPGDLIFFKDATGDVHHVGMSLGGDEFIHAPHTGDVVKVSSLNEPYFASQFDGGRRFDPAAGGVAPLGTTASVAEPRAVALAEAARSKDAVAATRPDTLVFRALTAQEASNHRSTLRFLTAVDPAEADRVREAAKAAAVPAAPEPAAPAPVASAPEPAAPAPTRAADTATPAPEPAADPTSPAADATPTPAADATPSPAADGPTPDTGAPALAPDPSTAPATALDPTAASRRSPPTRSRPLPTPRRPSRPRSAPPTPRRPSPPTPRPARAPTPPRPPPRSATPATPPPAPRAPSGSRARPAASASRPSSR